MGIATDYLDFGLPPVLGGIDHTGTRVVLNTTASKQLEDVLVFRLKFAPIVFKLRNNSVLARFTVKQFTYT